MIDLNVRGVFIATQAALSTCGTAPYHQHRLLRGRAEHDTGPGGLLRNQGAVKMSRKACPRGRPAASR